MKHEFLHPPVGGLRGVNLALGRGRRAIRKMFLDALPDLHIAVVDVLSEGNQSVVRWLATGTHHGELFGIPPTGACIDIRGMSWAVVRDGKLVVGFDTWNIGGLAETLRSAAAARAVST